MVVVAQLVRAPGCGPGGRRFETDLPPKQKPSTDVEGFLIEDTPITVQRAQRVKPTFRYNFLRKTLNHRIGP